MVVYFNLPITAQLIKPTAKVQEAELVSRFEKSHLGFDSANEHLITSYGGDTYVWRIPG